MVPVEVFIKEGIKRGHIMKEKKRFKVVYNAPVILSFTIACFITLILSYITGGFTNDLLFSVYKSSPLNPLTYIRLFTHVIGHANLEHLTGNIMMILVIGPMLEEKYGSKDLLFVILITALVTGLVNVIFFPNVQLLGASGIVFAFIILSSITGIRENEIPLTLILVAFLYLGDQIYSGIFVNDNISQLTHIVGGLIGGFMGYLGVPKK